MNKILKKLKKDPTKESIMRNFGEEFLRQKRALTLSNWQFLATPKKKQSKRWIFVPWNSFDFICFVIKKFLFSIPAEFCSQGTRSYHRYHQCTHSQRPSSSSSCSYENLRRKYWKMYNPNSTFFFAGFPRIADG